LIVLDTNVISELTRSLPSPAVLAWTRTVATADLFTTAVTEAELRFGLERLPEGRRRSALTSGTERLLDSVLQGRVLPFDRAASRYYAAFVAARFATGTPVKAPDAMIAAIARASGAALIATRDLGDFEGCGVPLKNPWAA
jgi:predicted nucleic acid-binding protein